MNKNSDNFEYIIAGDTEKYKGCLIYCCGNSKETAEKRLNIILNDNKYTDKYTNIRIETVPKEECWWNDKFLMN